MKLVKAIMANIVGSATLAAGTIIGMGVGAVLMDEKIEPWLMKKLHKEDEN